jgi:two-component system CheB/CheR fusion protein
MEWKEQGVVMSLDTPKRGYGRKLIEQALAYALRAKTSFSFGEDGVLCQIEMPLSLA